MSKSMKVFVLAGVLSLAVASAVQAGGKVTGGDFRANAAPACDTGQYPTLARALCGGPKGEASTGRRVAGVPPHSGQIPALWRRVLAGGRIVGSDFHASAAPVCDGTGRAQKTVHDDRLLGKECPLLATEGPTGIGDDNGRSSAELNTWHPTLAGGGVRGGDISF